MQVGQQGSRTFLLFENATISVVCFTTLFSSPGLFHFSLLFLYIPYRLTHPKSSAPSFSPQKFRFLYLPSTFSISPYQNFGLLLYPSLPFSPFSVCFVLFLLLCSRILLPFFMFIISTCQTVLWNSRNVYPPSFLFLFSTLVIPPRLFIILSFYLEHIFYNYYTTIIIILNWNYYEHHWNFGSRDFFSLYKEEKSHVENYLFHIFLILCIFFWGKTYNC